MAMSSQSRIGSALKHPARRARQVVAGVSVAAFVTGVSLMAAGRSGAQSGTTASSTRPTARSYDDLRRGAGSAVPAPSGGSTARSQTRSRGS